MKVLLEGSSLFFKSYTGIPHYIQKLYHAMQKMTTMEPRLAFRLKKKVGQKSESQKKWLMEPHVWHQNNFIFPPVKFDVIHSLHTPFLNTKKGLKVATVHDLAVHLPEFEELGFTSDYFKKKRFDLLRSFSKKADVIITVSERTKKDFLRFFDFPEENIHAVPLAPSINVNKKGKIDITDIKKLRLVPKNYFIAMGGVSIRKNTFNLIKGFAQSKSALEYKLVIIGKMEQPEGKKVLDYIGKAKLKSKVLLIGYVPNEQLNNLYANAKAFLFPTFYEGFGIPILEAMAAGLPVLTSTTGAAPETAGGHAVLVNPNDIDSIANGIDRLTTFGQKDIEGARQYSETFTWKKVAHHYAAVYQQYL